MRGSPWAGATPVVGGGGSETRHEMTVGENCLRTLVVDVPSEFMRAAVSAVLQEFMARVRMKGFRAGRVPPTVILKRHFKEIEQEAANRVVRGTLDDVLKAEGLEIFSRLAIIRVRIDDDASLSYTAKFEVHPEVKLGRLGGFRVERPPAVPPEGATDRILELLRKESGAWEPAQEGRPRDGDSVTVRMTPLDGQPEGEVQSRDYDLVLGEKQALPDVEEAIRTLNVGEEGAFDVAFPDDLEDGRDGRGAENRRLGIELLERRTRSRPPLDDDFARSVGDYEDLPALRAAIESDLERNARARAEAEYRDSLLDMVVEAHRFEVPASVVARGIKALLGRDEDDEDDDEDEDEEKEPEGVQIPWEDDVLGAGPDGLASAERALIEEARPIAEHAVRRDFLTLQIADEHDLHATDAEVDAQLREIARVTKEPYSRLRAELRRGRRLERLEQDITRRKVLDFLAERSPAS